LLPPEKVSLRSALARANAPLSSDVNIGLVLGASDRHAGVTISAALR
jgi:hypothetical protein